MNFYTVSMEEFLDKELKLITSFEDFAFWNILHMYDKKEAKDYLHKFFPDGLSKHGHRYLSEKYKFMTYEKENYLQNIPIMELTFELYRQIHHLDKPSRLTSMFGWQTLDEAKDFNSRYRGKAGRIYQVTTENYFIADMSFLYNGPSPLGGMIFADKYWTGKTSTNPIMEVLMQHPVKVIQEVEPNS